MKGAFAGWLPDVPRNVQFIEGWFSETLPKFLYEDPGSIFLLHVDCDLYSSTKCVFDMPGDRTIPGTVIVFDGYFNYPTGNTMSTKHLLNSFSTGM
jgi:hypothetical protein